MAQRHIKRITDFLDVPDSELTPCLNAFRLFILRSKADRQAAERDGFPAKSIQVESFYWNPHERASAQAIQPAGTTPLDELPLRHSVKRALRSMNVFCLEDFAEVSEREFHCIPDVGALTIENIRGLLACVGLRYKPPDDPVALLHEQNRVARKIPPDVRLASISDASSVAELGLTPGTFGRALEKKHYTVGTLRSLTIREIAFAYGKRQGQEIMDTLAKAGLALTQAPSQTELWFHGFLKLNQLVLPDPLAPLHDFSPWIGNALVSRLQERGVNSIPQLAALLESQQAVAVPGIGKRTCANLRSFLAWLKQEPTGRWSRLHEKAPTATHTAPVCGPAWLEAPPK